MFNVKKGNKNTKSLAYRSLVRPILEYGAACWDPYRKCQISALDRVQNKAAKFAHHSGGSDWESLAQRRKIACMCALYYFTSTIIIIFFINVYMVLFLFNNVIYVFLLYDYVLFTVCLCMTTLTEVFPCFFLSCKANARVKPAKTGYGPPSS